MSQNTGSKRKAGDLGASQKLGVPFWGVPITRIRIFLGLYWGKQMSGVSGLVPCSLDLQRMALGFRVLGWGFSARG